MMKKSARMASIVKVAESDEQRAAQALGKSQQQLDVHRERLEQLVDYRSEYVKQLQERASGGISVSQIQSYRAFISQLDLGIEEQHKVIDNMQLDVESKRQEWFARRSQTQAMDKVMSKYHYQEQLLEGKRDQKESDERAQGQRCGMLAFE